MLLPERHCFITGFLGYLVEMSTIMVNRGESHPSNERTKFLYAIRSRNKSASQLTLLSTRMTPMDLIALSEIIWKWGAHVSRLSKITPRYLTSPRQRSIQFFTVKETSGRLNLDFVKTQNWNLGMEIVKPKARSHGRTESRAAANRSLAPRISRPLT